MKIVINACFGGFGLSDEAVVAYAKRKGFTVYVERKNSLFADYWTVPPEQRQRDLDDGEWHAMTDAERAAHNARYAAEHFSVRDIKRDDPDLVAVVEQLREAANDACSRLVVVEIPDDVQWEISEYDGNEHVAEQHRTWYGSDEE
ncbi:TPA: hypothetical protein ACT5B2_003861 [Burkholderia cenocepacia]|uniref:hypothetical protein n=1 Tax=Burkholderia cenocepacia TaxID=95486 RepID=UPI002AB603DF|nr:hypothetical protein [Burkholderia cenocepacia]